MFPGIIEATGAPPLLSSSRRPSSSSVRAASTGDAGLNQIAHHASPGSLGVGGWALSPYTSLSISRHEEPYLAGFGVSRKMTPDCSCMFEEPWARKPM